MKVISNHFYHQTYSLSSKYIICSCHILRQLFQLAEGCSKMLYDDLLHSYCLGRNRFIQAFARPEIFYYSGITVAPFSRQISLEVHFLNAQH